MRTDGALPSRGGALWVAALPALLFALACPANAHAQVYPAPLTASDAGEKADAPAASPSSGSSEAALATAAPPRATPAAVGGEESAAAPAPGRAKAGNATAAVSGPGSGEAENLAPTPPGTMEIPPAVPSLQAPPLEPEAQRPGSDITPNQDNQSPPPYPNLGSLREFVAEGEEISSIGVRLREAQRGLKTGEQADGLLVLGVTSGSPAEKAGLRPYSRTVHSALMGAAIAAAMVFPPAILVVPALDYAQVGESYDMIIGIDGARVTNFFDFEGHMRGVQPGEIVYLSVVRDGRRVQLAVPVPLPASSASY